MEKIEGLEMNAFRETKGINVYVKIKITFSNIRMIPQNVILQVFDEDLIKEYMNMEEATEAEQKK